MSTQQVIDTLKNETELLQGMIKFVEQYPNKGFTNQALYIQKSWARFLGERHATNIALAEKSGDKLKKDLQSEQAQIEDYIKASYSSPDYSEQWSKFLECERDILKHLIGLCDP